MIQTILLKVYLFFAGIKFLETNAMPPGEPLRSLRTRTIEGQEIVFSLYKENCVKSTYRFGHIKRQPFTGFVVKCDMPDGGASLYRCSGFSLLFKGAYLERASDITISRLLIQLYMHEMHERLVNEQA